MKFKDSEIYILGWMLEIIPTFIVPPWYCISIVMLRISLLLVLFVTGFMQAQIVVIPDVNFKNALVNENVADLGNSIIADVLILIIETEEGILSKKLLKEWTNYTSLSEVSAQIL